MVRRYRPSSAEIPSAKWRSGPIPLVATNVEIFAVRALNVILGPLEKRGEHTRNNEHIENSLYRTKTAIKRSSRSTVAVATLHCATCVT